MISSKNNLQGWNIVAYSALIIGMLLALILITQGINEQSMRIAIRATARTSCILFLLAFIASALRRIWSTKLSQWMRLNRRYLGLSFAVSHGFHALAIIGLAIVTPHDAVYNNHGGNLGYLFIIAMTATSFSSTASWVGERSWQILHTVGMYYLWLAFIYTFAQKLTESTLVYLPFVILLIAAMILRLIVLKTPKKLIN
jgi:hypothetical protein